MGILNQTIVGRAVTPNGTAVARARRHVFFEGSDVLATLYEDPDLTTLTSNPMISDANGDFGLCYLADGTYCVRITMAEGKLLSETNGVQVLSNSLDQTFNAFNTIGELLADQTLSVTGGKGKARVAVGQMVHTRKRGHAYEVAPMEAADYHLATTGGLKLYADDPIQEIETDVSLIFKRGAKTNPGAIIRQADGTNLSTMVQVALSNVTADMRRGVVDLHVDGSRANNTADVTGIKVVQLKRGFSDAKLAAHDCDTGILIKGNVEYANITAAAEGCTTGVHVESDGTTTPDELVMTVLGHDCGTFFEVSGSNKTSGIVTFGCEQSATTAAIIRQGWWELHGELRGCSTDSAGVGLLIEKDPAATTQLPYVTGRLRIAGGSDTNCTWVADIQDGYLEALQLNGISKYASGVRVGGGVEGSALVNLQSVPDNGVGLELGDDAALIGFHVLPGSRIEGGGVNITNCQGCVLDFSHLVGSVTIGSGSYDNTIYVPRRQAENSVTFVNNRTSADNKIIYRGSYTLSEMNALNGSAPFKGMEVEYCVNYRGARCYFDGASWVPSHGLLASGTVTIASGDTQGIAAHGLPSDPGNATLSVFPEGDWGSATGWWANVTSASVVVNCDAAPGADVTFRWTLRQTA